MDQPSCLEIKIRELILNNNSQEFPTLISFSDINHSPVIFNNLGRETRDLLNHLLQFAFDNPRDAIGKFMLFEKTNDLRQKFDRLVEILNGVECLLDVNLNRVYPWDQHVWIQFSFDIQNENERWMICIVINELNLQVKNMGGIKNIGDDNILLLCDFGNRLRCSVFRKIYNCLLSVRPKINYRFQSLEQQISGMISHLHKNYIGDKDEDNDNLLSVDDYKIWLFKTLQI